MARSPEAQLEHETDRLYGLPLNEFVPARDELAKRRRDQGKRELADDGTGLRKPPVAAWVANRLARECELDVQRLLNAGEALTTAQAEAASGDSPEAFAEARRDEQRALERLAAEARETIAREGIGAAALGRVLQTLRAASLTSDGRELLKRGRLSEELEPPGFEAISGLVGTTTKPQRRSGRPSERGERLTSVARQRQGRSPRPKRRARSAAKPRLSSRSCGRTRPRRAAIGGRGYAPSSASSGPVSSGSKPMRPAISSLEGLVPSLKRARSRVP